MSTPYIFTSPRLGFRLWEHADIEAMALINSDAVVMEFFPSLQGMEQTTAFAARMNKQYADKSHCYFAVDRLDTGAFIGFIGISEQTFDAPFTPCTDVGWRLAQHAWGNGFATEGANACLQYARHTCGHTTIKAVAPAINIRSVNVMEKLGMKKEADFIHPLWLQDERLRDCVLYSISL
jgi:RimJ/RimL family protein N-acetyltransferase